MPSSFSITQSRYASFADPDLLQEIRSHTGSDAEASSILRSMERFGGDASISYYEVTPKPRRGASRQALPLAWSVRAVRT